MFREAETALGRNEMFDALEPGQNPQSRLERLSWALLVMTFKWQSQSYALFPQFHPLHVGI